MTKRQIIVDGPYSPFFCKWAADKLGVNCFNPETSRTIAIVTDHEVLGVIVLNNWTKYHCEASIATDETGRWASRDVVYTYYDYVFRHANRIRINTMVEVGNEKAIKMHKSLGDTYEATLKDWFGPGKDGILYRMTKDEFLASKWNWR